MWFKLEIFSDDEMLETKTVDQYTWYDGDMPEIDSDSYRRERKVTLIRVVKYGEREQDIEEIYLNFYDTEGRITKTDSYDSDNNLLDTYEFEYDEQGKLMGNWLSKKKV